MKRLLLAATLLLGTAALLGAQEGAGTRLPVQIDGFLLAPVDDALAGQITAAQDGKGAAFTIAIDGAPAAALTVAPERLRDYQNVYYRVTGQPGSWRLEEQGFSAAGADAESLLIRRALRVPEEKKVFFLPGRAYLLFPAQSRVLLRAGNAQWDFQGEKGKRGPTRAVLVRAGQPLSLVLSEAVSAASADKGAAVPLLVAADLRVDGLLAVAKGTPVEAHVAEVLHPDVLGSPGVLVLQLGAVQALDGTPISLRADADSRIAFQGRSGFLFLRAGNIQLPAGTRIPAQVVKTTTVLAPVQ